MALAKQVLPIRIKGLDTKSTDELGPSTDIGAMSNMMALRTTDGGYEFRKRYGVTALSTSIEGGGSVTAGFKIVSFNNELLITDGNIMYSWSSILSKWIKKGYVADIASNISTISTSGDVENNGFSNIPIDVDVAYLSGYECYVTDRGNINAPCEFYVIERATGNMVGNGPIDAGTGITKVRVVGVGTAFYIFYVENGSAATIRCRKIDLSAPETISAASSVAVNFSANLDVIADVTNTRILLAYQNTTPTTTIAVWNTNMTAGTSTAYATRNPDKGVGFLDDVTPLNVAIGTSATGVRILTFNSGTLVVSADVLIDGAATDTINVSGYNSGTLNAVYTRPGTPTRNDIVWCCKNGGTPFTAARSASLQSRPITNGTQGGAGKRYILIGHNEDSTIAPGSGDRVRALLLMQLDQDGNSQATVRVCGVINPSTWGGWASRTRTLGSAIAISATSILMSSPTVEGPTATLSGALTFPVQRIDLDFSGNSTGAPAAFNNTMFFPGSSTKVYDGRNVFENGFYHRPDQPTLTRVGGGGTMTAGIVQFVLLYSYIDSNGKLWRSAVSNIASVTTVLNDRIDVVMPTLRLTDRNPAFTITNTPDPQVKMELYMTKPNQSVFYLAQYVFNLPSADTNTASFTVDIAGSTEILYTQGGALTNEYPPNVLAVCAHSDRIFFMCGDRSVWFTRQIENDEDMPAGSSLFRIQLGTEFGSLTGIVSMDTGLVISRRTRMQILVGQGPSKDGSGPYQYPMNINADVGFNNVHSFCGTPQGIIFQSQKGFQFLSRSGNVDPVYGIDEDMTTTMITGAVALDDLPFVIFSGTPVKQAVYDWQFKTWYEWSNSSQLNSVSIGKWQGSAVWLKADGTVNKQTSGTWNDNGNAIDSSISFGWISLGDIFANSRVYNLEFLIKAMATVNIIARVSYDYDQSTIDSDRTIAVTSAFVGVMMVRPSRRRTQALYATLVESSTTEGFRITALGIELGMKRGSRKQPSSRFAV